MKRSVSEQTLDNPQIEVQEVLKKARHDDSNSPTILQAIINNVVDQQTAFIASDGPSNGDLNNEIDSTQYQNGHHENGTYNQNGFNGINGSSHEQQEADISVNGAFDLEHVPDQFMAEDNTEPELAFLDITNQSNETHTEEVLTQIESQISDIVEEKHDETKAEETQKTDIEAPTEDLAAGSSRSEGWDQQELYTWTMQGHSDEVTAVALDENLLVTASADTTVRVWDIDSRTELCSLGGHKAAVTSVYLLSIVESRDLLEKMKTGEEPEEGRVILSGSSDCNVKIWLAPQGKLLRSMYTFNGIVRVGYVGDGEIVTGTDAGKIELFDAISGETLGSVKAFDLPVAALKVSGGMIISGDTHGTLKAWNIRERRLHCLKTANAVQMERKTLVALDFSGNCVVTGHVSGSIKSLSWTTGVVKRLKSTCKGRVDDLNVTQELLVTSSSNSELAALHFYELPKGQYLGSVQGESKMSSVSATRCGRGWRFVTGGKQLRVWETQCTEANKDGQTARVTLWPQLEEAESDSEDETDGEEPVKQESSPRKTCTIL